MKRQTKIALLGSLLLAGMALLLMGQANLGQPGLRGTWSLAAGLLLLVGAAGLAYYQRHGRRPQPPLVGEYRGVLASEEGFVPMRGGGEAQRQQVQRRIVGKPERAAESVRGLLGEQVRQARPGRPAPGAGNDKSKRRKGDG
ncbi:MAG: hypothetical protein IT369_05100 [Candidatus Latescibacteria bacterium]|nr:hypothetical protein [Candidatus Latescibacterota bacterium]